VLFWQEQSKANFLESTTEVSATQLVLSQNVVSTNTPDIKGDYLLEIPSIDFSLVVHNITKKETVNNEPWGIQKKLLDKYGITDSPLFGFPNADKMVAIAGHRDVFGSPFWSIDKIENNDKITITLKNGKVIEYVVYNITVNDENERAYLTTLYHRELRLVSCLIGSTRKRIFIYAYQVE